MSDPARDVLFIVTAIFLIGCAAVGLRVARDRSHPRPPWVGWLIVATSLPNAVLAIVLLVLAD